jgi:hypothetical protein
MRQIRSAARIARQLRETEAAMDQAILRANALVTAMIEARIEGRLAAEVGQEALDNIVRGLRAMSEARGAIARGHGDLAKVADDLAIEWRMDGPLEEKIKEMPSFHAQEQNAA